MKNLTLQTAKETVNSIYHLRDEEFILKSLNSFGFESKKQLQKEINKMIKIHLKNKSKFNYFAQYFSEFQMSIFTTFEEKLRSVLNCSEQIKMLSNYNI
jgi:hypothetical protein